MLKIRNLILWFLMFLVQWLWCEAEFRAEVFDRFTVINGTIAENVTTKSRQECAVRCFQEDHCISYWYQHDSSCSLIKNETTQGDAGVIYTVGRNPLYVRQDDCSEDACLNNGVCKDGADSFTCICAPGVTGNRCETDPDGCIENPCRNDGTCQDELVGYTCTCVTGFTGPNCEINIDDCSGSPCQNGGTCEDGVDSYTCSCVTGFIGNNCETNIDDCQNVTCENGGTCEDGVNSYICSCVAGFTGQHCETNIDECDPNPCATGFICEDGVDSYICLCPAGFNGANCQNNINECNGVNCRNGGTCQDGIATYTCNCKAGFSGVHCDDGIVYSHTFETTSGYSCYSSCVLAAGRVGGGALEVLKNDFTGQYASWTSIDACILTPDTCTPGGTLMFWLKVTSCEDGDGIMSSMSNSPGGQTGIIVRCQPETHLKFLVAPNGVFSYSTSLTLNTWFHRTLVFHGKQNGKGFSLYRNGAHSGSTTSKSSGSRTAGNGKFVIGRQHTDWDDNYASVQVDELKFWDFALTASEVQELYNEY